MARKNAFVKMGRPKGVAMPAALPPMAGGAPPGGASPMAGFAPSIPGGAFRMGGSVNGHKSMPSHHDDPRMRAGHSEHGHTAFCRGGKAK